MNLNARSQRRGHPLPPPVLRSARLRLPWPRPELEGSPRPLGSPAVGHAAWWRVRRRRAMLLMMQMQLLVAEAPQKLSALARLPMRRAVQWVDLW